MRRIMALCAALIIIITVTCSVYASSDKTENIAADAVIDAPECAPDRSTASLCDGKYPSVSYQPGGGDGYSSHDYAGGFSSIEEYGVYDNVEEITFTWDHDVTVGSIGIYFYCSAPERTAWLMFGGNDTPAYYAIEYKLGDEYITVADGDGFGVERDAVNITTFEAVTTRSIRITMTKLSDAERAEFVDGYISEQGALGNKINQGFVYRGLGVGISEIMIYSAESDESTETETSETEASETEASETEAPETTSKREDTSELTGKETSKSETTSKREEETTANHPEPETTDAEAIETETTDSDTVAITDTADEIDTSYKADDSSAGDAETLYYNDGSAFDSDHADDDIPWLIFVIVIAVITLAIGAALLIYKK